MNPAMTSLHGNWFLLTSHPEKVYATESFGESGTAGTPRDSPLASPATVLLAGRSPSTSPVGARSRTQKVTSPPSSRTAGCTTSGSWPGPSSTSPRGIHTRALGTWSLRARGGARLFDLRSRHSFRCARRVAGRGVCCLPEEWHRRGPTADECQITIQAAPVSRPRAETVNWSDYWNGARGFEPWFETSWCPWLTKPRTSLPVRGRESMISKQ